MSDSATSDDGEYRTVDSAEVRETDIYDTEREFFLEIEEGSISGPFASDYCLLTELLAYHELPVNEAGVESLVGCDVPVAVDSNSREWIAVDSGKLRERIGIERMDP